MKRKSSPVALTTNNSGSYKVHRKDDTHWISHDVVNDNEAHPMIRDTLQKHPITQNNETYYFLDPRASLQNNMLNLAKICGQMVDNLEAVEDSLVTCIKEYFLIEVQTKSAKVTWVDFINQLGKLLMQ
jgi:hypothetical protein